MSALDRRSPGAAAVLLLVIAVALGSAVAAGPATALWLLRDWFE